MPGSEVIGGAQALDAMLRTGVSARAQGLIAETLPRAQAGLYVGGTVSGTLFAVGVPLLAGDVVSNLSIIVTAAGAAATLSKLGLYSKAGVLLASSVDQGTSWQSAGPKTVAMSTPYTVPTTDLYYVALLYVGTSTLAAFARGWGSGTTALIAAIGSGSLPFASQAGLSDLPAPATLVNTAAPLAFWMGVS